MPASTARRACPKFLRQSFHEFGECSIRYCPWAQALLPKPNALAAKVTHAAVRAVTFKWIRILFACWKQRTPYDPQRYFQALQTRGSDYGPNYRLTHPPETVNKRVNKIEKKVDGPTQMSRPSSG